MPNERPVFRNILLNSLGIGLPILVALIAFPLLVAGLGVDRFGVLSLCWLIVGYFSIFDLGLGRAVTKLVAEQLGAAKPERVPSIVSTGVGLLLAIGLLAGCAFFLAAEWVATGLLDLSGDLAVETLSSFRMLAFVIPAVVISAGLAGVLEAYQAFALLNRVRIPLGIATFAVPVAVLPFSQSLVAIIGALILCRLAAVLGYWACVAGVAPGSLQPGLFSRATAAVLLRLGGWISVSNTISPLMVYMDRFFVGAQLSVSAVAYYTAPYEVVTRSLLVPRAIMGVLFPEFAFRLSMDTSSAMTLLNRSLKYLFALMFPVCAVFALFAEELLRFWLGAEFAVASSLVVQILALGVLVNGVAQVPFGYLQSMGRADLTAKLHLVEFPAYIVALIVLTERFGIAGTAMAWSARVIVDALVLFAFVGRLVPGSKAGIVRLLAGLSGALVVIFLASQVPDLPVRGGLAAACLAGWAVACRRYVFGTEEAVALRSLLARFTRGSSA